MQQFDDVQVVRELIALWYKRRAWAESLLKSAFDLTEMRELFRLGRGITRPIPETDWLYRTHGIGVDVSRADGSGGIDFDFDKPDPDPWRLWVFAQKQLTEPEMPGEIVRPLAEDRDRLTSAFQQAVVQNGPST